MTVPTLRTLVRVAALTVVAALLLVAAPAVAAPKGPGTVAVETANVTIAKLLKKKVKPGSAGEKELASKVTTAVRGLLDLDQLGRAALDAHWAKLSAPQQQEYLSLLRSILEAEYVKGLRANVAYTVTYGGEAAGAAGEIVVKTTINAKRKGRPFKIAVDYVLRTDAGALRAYDVKTDGVGLVENYRGQFSKIIDKKGVDGLLATLRKKLAST